MQPKQRVILDSSVVVSGIGWRGGDARKVLTLLAIGGFESHRTPWLAAEWADTVRFVAENERRWKNPNWINWLAWRKRASKMAADIQSWKFANSTAQFIIRKPNFIF